MTDAINPSIRLQYRPYTLDPQFPVFTFAGQNKPSNPFHRLNDGTDQARYMHLHNCVEVTCVTCSSARLYVEKDVHLLQRGDLVIVMPFTAHFLMEDGTDPSCDYLYFDPKQLLTCFLPGLLNRFPLFSGSHCSCLIIPAAQQGPMTGQALRIIRELQEQQGDYQLNVCSLLVSMMVEASRFYAAQPAAMQQAASPILSIMPAVHFISDHYMHPIALHQLEELCHLSGTQLRRVFNSVMGCAPLAYIQQVRIGHACALLRTTRMGLAEIAQAVGYESVSSFHRQFVRYHGMAPSLWRRQHVGGNTMHLPEKRYDATKN